MSLTVINGRAYPLGLANVDTDIIIASHWLKTISRTGLGRGAFAALRENPGNVFDDPRYAGAPILIAGANFGCGSSREHAAWALTDLGIRVIIAPSFSDIFSSNAFKNGILTVALPQETTDELLAAARTSEIRVDLERQCVATVDGRSWRFEIDPFRRHCLLNGLDEIQLTLAHAAEIEAHESRTREIAPWLASVGSD